MKCTLYIFINSILTWWSKQCRALHSRTNFCIFFRPITFFLWLKHIGRQKKPLTSIRMNIFPCVAISHFLLVFLVSCRSLLFSSALGAFPVLNIPILTSEIWHKVCMMLDFLIILDCLLSYIWSCDWLWNYFFPFAAFVERS